MLEHRFLLFMVLVTFILISLGGFVHNTESSLACLEWPTCKGMCKGKGPTEGQSGVDIERRHQIEMLHRIIASFIGMCTIIFFMILMLRKRYQSKLAKLAIFAVFLVLAQGGLGAATVLLRLPTIVSVSHMAVAELFFALLILLYHFTKYSGATETVVTSYDRLRSTAILMGVVTLCIYLQILLGGYMRHSGYGLAAGHGPQAALLGMDVTNRELSLWPTLAGAKWNVLHRYMALVVLLFVSIASVRMFRLGKELKQTSLKVYSILGLTVTVAQIVLGVLSIWYVLPVKIVTLHLALGTVCFGIFWSGYLNLKFIYSPWNYLRPEQPGQEKGV